MMHVAIQEQLDGKVVDWMGKVSDEQYQLGAGAGRRWKIGLGSQLSRGTR
jgi:hypothetical protein